MGDLKQQRNEYDERYEILVEEIIKEFNVQREFERELLNTFVTEARQIHNRYYKRDLIKVVLKFSLIAIFGIWWIYWYFHSPYLTENFNQINNSSNSSIYQSEVK